jgi:hypothetical protein
MLRVFGAFLVVFSILSVIVDLNGLATVFGMAALCLFTIDVLVTQLVKAPQSASRRGEAAVMGVRNESPISALRRNQALL